MKWCDFGLSAADGHLPSLLAVFGDVAMLSSRADLERICSTFRAEMRN
jgi:hypothetical protein